MTDQRSLQAIGLGLGYGERSVISGLDLDIAPGQITSIVGANGYWCPNPGRWSWTGWPSRNARLRSSRRYSGCCRSPRPRRRGSS